MAASNQVVGRATISLGAIGVVPTEHGATLNPGGVKRNPKASDNGRTYFSAETASPELSCKVMATVGMNSLLLNFEGATVVFEADTGQKYMLINAFTTDPVPLDTSAGTYDLKLSAESCEVM